MNTDLQRSPVYQQLNDRLREALHGDYRRGDRFLTEREISDRFGVSRATANKALASLVSEGLLEFRRGVGTFVQRDLISYDLRSLVSFTEKARAAGKRPSTELLKYETLAAPDAPQEVVEALQADSTDRLVEMHRLRLADGVPVIYEQRFVVLSGCPRLTRAQATRSLYKAFTDQHGLDIGGADEVIRAVSVTGQRARALKVKQRSPGLEVVATGLLSDGAPLWWERTLYRGDRYEFHSRLGPVRTATPARGVLTDVK